ncbi:MBL fold metallo-hydrolase [Kocuria massiliensis]|uniref:MBL fold metallo-hydrolase n=1 Tax=Kocuria massiliensis TaxID=1926282 RepID=UPI0022B998CE|nr:MBL fold metallo-hydrolase [Kocuria massiliensis]
MRHVNQWAIGNVTVHKIDETQFSSRIGAWLLPDVDPDDISDSRHRTPGGGIASGTHSFALVSEGLKILVDTGIGNDKPRANPAWDHLDTPYLDRLTEAGFSPGTVDLVLLTHLHADHVGWNTVLRSGRWEATFPQAEYVMNRAERDYWKNAALEPSRAAMIGDSIEPLEALGLLSLPDVPPDGLDITPEVRLIPTPGHTPGHLSVLIQSDGFQALISGDALHHSIQVERPEINASVDIDGSQARSTRLDLLRWAAKDHLLLLGSHFPSPAGGYVETEGSTFRFRPVGNG